MRKSGCTISTDEYNDIVSVFNLLDSNGKDAITVNEALVGLTALGCDIKVDEIIKAVSPGEVVTQREFYKLALAHLDRRELQTFIRTLYDMLDLEGKGYVTAQDIKRKREELGMTTLTDRHIEQMIEAADTLEEGKVTFQDFRKLAHNWSGTWPNPAMDFRADAPISQ